MATAECSGIVEPPDHTVLTAVVFGPRSGRMLTAGEDGRVLLWSANGLTPEEMCQLPAAVDAIAISDDERYIAAGSRDAVLRVWGLPMVVKLTEFHGHRQMIGGVAFSPNGRYVISASEDTTVRMWDLRAERRRGVLGRFYGAADP